MRCYSPALVAPHVSVAVEQVINTPQIAVDVNIQKTESAIDATRRIGLQKPEVVRIALDERQILHFAGIHHAPQICFA